MSETFRKTVDIKTVDEEARTATGAVLVPDELDHQGDFLRPEGVERFHSEDIDTGVMHSAFPGDAAALERSEVIDEPEEIGGEQFSAGTWVATRRYVDDRLWQLVADGVLTGFSIGGDIAEAREYEDVPDDVTVPDAVADDVTADGVTELVDGAVNEVSDVDIPAVPRATYKGDDLGKAILEEVSSEAEFVDLMTEQRGHDEADARRLYQYLTDVRDEQPPDGEVQNVSTSKYDYESGDFVSWDASGGRATGRIVDRTEDGQFSQGISGDITVEGSEEDPAYLIEVFEGRGEDAEPIDEESGRGDTMHVAHRESELREVSDPREQAASKSGVLSWLTSRFGGSRGSDDGDDPEAPNASADRTKAGRTLSADNTAAAKAVVDAASELLAQADDVDAPEPFTTRNDDDFEMSEFSLAAHDGDEEMDGEAGEDGTESEAAANHAPGGDTPDTDTNMTDSNGSDKSERPEWADSLTEKVEQIETRINDLEDDDAAKALDDAPEWAQDLAAKVDDLDERVETISKQSGHSQQLGKADGDGTTPDSDSERFKQALGSTGGEF
jgi:hypothetical protein